MPVNGKSGPFGGKSEPSVGKSGPLSLVIRATGAIVKSRTEDAIELYKFVQLRSRLFFGQSRQAWLSQGTREGEKGKLCFPMLITAEVERAMLNLTQTNTSRITRILSGFILTLVMCMFIAPGAMAGCNAKGKGKDCPPLSPPARGDSVVVLTGSLVHNFDSDNVTRRCGSGPDISNASGDYHCNVSDYPDIVMNTQGLTVIFNKKNRIICNSLAFQFLEDPAILQLDEDTFNYGWTDDCTDGCTIEVRMTFSGGQILTATDNKADSLDVVMTGTIDTATPDGNPFLVYRDIFIETMDFNFKKPGTNRTAGSCMFYTNPALTFPQIQFESEVD